MKYNLPKRILNLTPYSPIDGDYDIRLDANEGYFELTQAQKSLLSDKMAEIPFNRYPDPYAVALCEKFADFYGVKASAVVAFNGSDESIGLLVSTFFEKHDKIAVFEQDFSMYKVYTEIYGVECVTLPKRADLTIDVDMAIERINSEGISAVIFSNPCNPTSIAMKRAEVIRLIESVEALVIVDEAYMDFCEESIIDVASSYENVILLKTCSKAVNLAGMRIGFTVANTLFTLALKASKAPYNLNRVSQVVGEIVLSDKAFLENAFADTIKQTALLKNRVSALADKYSGIECVYPSATNFVYIKTPLAERCFVELLEKSIAIRYMKQYLRVSCGTAEENEKFLAEFENILKNA